jgi:hypothetical protein
MPSASESMSKLSKYLVDTKVQAVCSSEILVTFLQTTRRTVTEDSIFCKRTCATSVLVRYSSKVPAYRSFNGREN